VRARLAGAAALVLVAAGCGGGGEQIPALPFGSFITASGTVTPQIHLFGDTIEATADVVVDHTRLDPDAITFKTSFAPYEEVGKTSVERSDGGPLTHLSYKLRLRCLERDCITSTLGTIVNPGGSAPRVFNFQPGQVLYTDPGAKQPRLLRTVRFPPIEAVTRINAQDSSQVYGFPFRGSALPLPRLTYGIAPTTLAILLLLVATALLVLPVTLLVRWVRRLRQSPPPEPEPEPTALERAVALVEWSRARENGEERRAALDALAAALDGADADGLADDVRIAAWSPASPSPTDAARILVAVKERDGDAA
jgi:hypothetical protein